MASKQLIVLAFAACIFAAHAQAPKAAAAPAAVFKKANIVKNVTADCPVKNTMWAKSEFDVARVMEMGATMGEKGVSEKCTNAALENLAACATDGSMEIKVGCCSEDCASGIKKSIDSGCFTEYAQAFCSDKASQDVIPGLLNAGMRCANYSNTCEKILAASPKKANATTTGNATKTTASPAPKDAAPAAKPKSSAMHSTMAAVVPLAAAAAAFLVL